MAKPVIDRFEAVRIDDDKAERRSLTPRRCYRFGSQPFELLAVEEPGQRIDGRALQQRFVSLAIGKRIEDIGKPCA